VKKYIGKYVGPNKIIKASKAKRKTYLGNEVIEVEFENGDKKEYPRKILDETTTKEKTDLSELREKRVKSVTSEVIGICAEAELTRPEIEYALGAKLNLSLNYSMKVARNILWDKDADDLTLYDIDRVIKKNQKKNAKKDPGTKSN